MSRRSKYRPSVLILVHRPFPVATASTDSWDSIAVGDDLVANIIDANILDSFGAKLIGFGGEWTWEISVWHRVGALIDLAS
jgi:hypothetical protein